VSRGSRPLLTVAAYVGVVVVASSVSAVAAPGTQHARTAKPKATEVSTFKAPSPVVGDKFGNALAVSGDTLVIAAPHRTVGTNKYVGAVFVYTKTKKGWTSKHPVELSFPPTTSGPDEEPDDITAVAVSGTTIVLGDNNAAVKGVQQGAAYVYQEPTAGWKTTTHPTAVLSAKDGVVDDFFGEAVSISADTIVVGAPLHTVKGHLESGAAYVFNQPKNGHWKSATQNAELTSSDAADQDGFGASVGISQQTIVIGAPEKTIKGVTQVGEAYIYVEGKKGWRNATQTRKIEPTGLSHYAQLGNLGAIAVVTGTIAIGAPYWAGNQGVDPAAPGRVYVLNEPKAGWAASKATITKAAVLTAKHGIPFDLFGTTVAISKSILSIGAIGHTIGTTQYAGANYVFAKPKTGGWKTATQTLIVTQPHVQSISEFGAGALSGDTLLVGAPYANAETGGAFVFTLTGSAFPPPKK
jgi:FG-GAP repeat